MTDRSFYDLTSFETGAFPADRCTKPNAREPGLLDSDDRYLCLVVDPRWPSEARLVVCTPYTCPSLDDGGLLFGWALTTSDGWVDHAVRSVHDDREVAVAWRRVESADVNFVRDFLPQEDA